MKGKHKLRTVRRKGREMLRCKHCGLLCQPAMQAQAQATKCPGRQR
jgi:hypothetical protein